MNRKGLLIQIVSLLVLVLASCSPQPTATPLPPTATTVPTNTPTKVPVISPSRRGYVSLAYDIESDKMIMFGGSTGRVEKITLNNETWVFDVASNEWSEMKPSSAPPAISAADLTYDVESDRVIMFGGGTINYDAADIMNDTWAYDYNTNTWTKLGKGPVSCIGSRIAYDAESDRVILFGGSSLSGSNDDKTFAYDFNSDTWTKMDPEPHPSGRNYHGMAYDSESDRVLLWGGSQWDSQVWAYDYNNNTWQAMASNEGPDTRYYLSLAYDSKADRTIIYGGIPNKGDLTWAYDYNTNTWTLIETATNPGFLTRYAMAYSTAADKVILFGGRTLDGKFYEGDTWAFDLNANTWVNVVSQP